MAPSPSSDTGVDLPDTVGALLVDLARRSIRSGFEGRSSFRPDLATLPAGLAEPHGAFVTVLVDGELNGCIGTVEATRPLADVVASNARSAAFGDPRLPKLSLDQLDTTELEVSVLSPLEPMAVGSLEELLSELRPGTDGLSVEDGPRRAVFLPQVWEQLQGPAEFVAHLQEKAGMVAGSWSPRMRWSRFTVAQWSEPWGRAGT